MWWACSSTGALPAVVRRVAPALACGNAVVLVPDPDAPLGALMLAEAAAEAGLPDGVLNVVPGGVLAGDVDAVAVTGPPAFCRDAARLLPGRPVGRETTGGLAQIVHDDAPLDQAVDGIVEALGGDQRVLVAESVADEFGELLRERLTRLRVGDPLDHNTDLGPIGSAGRRDRTVALATAADDEGARRVDQPHPAARARVVPGADRVHRRRADDAGRPRADPRPAAAGADLPDAGRGRGDRRCPARRRRLDGQGQPGPVDGAAAAGGTSCG